MIYIIRQLTWGIACTIYMLTCSITNDKIQVKLNTKEEVFYMEENGLIERPKLGFIDRIRKRMLITFMSVKRFNNADSIITNEPDVIDAFFKKFPDQIMSNRKIPSTMRDEAILRNQSLLEHLDGFDRENFILKHFNELKHPKNILRDASRDLQNKLLKQRPELINEIRKPISYLKECRECIKYLPEEQQFRVISGEIEVDGRKSFPDEYKLSDFSDQVVKKFVIQEILKEKQRPATEIRRIEHRHKDIYNCDFSALSPELQLQFALLDNRLLDKMSPEVIERFVDGNMMVLSEVLPSNARAILIERNPQYANQVIIRNKKRTDIFWKKIWQSGEQGAPILTLEDAKKMFLVTNYRVEPVYFGKLSRKLAIPDIYEFGKTFPDIYAQVEYDDFANFRKRINSFKTFISKTQSQKIKDALMQRKDKLISEEEKRKEYLWISRIMTNTDILNAGNEDRIADYINEPSIKKLKEIICEVYGEDNRAIFDNRPLLEIDNIDNFYIFSPKIKEVFGIDFVNDMLTYDSGAPRNAC